MSANLESAPLVIVIVIQVRMASPMVVAESVTSNSLKKQTPKLSLLTSVAKAKFNIHIRTHMHEYSFEYLIFSRN